MDTLSVQTAWDAWILKQVQRWIWHLLAVYTIRFKNLSPLYSFCKSISGHFCLVRTFILFCIHVIHFQVRKSKISNPSKIQSSTEFIISVTHMYKYKNSMKKRGENSNTCFMRQYFRFWVLGWLHGSWILSNPALKTSHDRWNVPQLSPPSGVCSAPASPWCLHPDTGSAGTAPPARPAAPRWKWCGGAWFACAPEPSSAPRGERPLTCRGLGAPLGATRTGRLQEEDAWFQLSK